MTTIDVGRGMQCIIDEADLELVKPYRWYAWKAPRHKGFYACANLRRSGQKGSIVYMHRVIVQPPAGMVVDHRDGNPLNNTRANLRVCTQKQNCANIRSRVGKSGYRGVKIQPWGSFAAEIHAHGVYTYLGTFQDAISAARAFDKAALEAYGEFAVLNFPSLIKEVA